MNRKNDQLVHAAPIAFPSTEVANTILSGIYLQFQTAAEVTRKQEAVAFERAEDIARRQGDINHHNQEIARLEVENTEADRERNEALAFAQRQRDLAKGAADTLAFLGHPIPAEQLDVLRDGNWARVEKLHDELDATQGVSPL